MIYSQSYLVSKNVTKLHNGNDQLEPQGFKRKLIFPLFNILLLASKKSPAVFVAPTVAKSHPLWWWPYPTRRRSCRGLGCNVRSASVKTPLHSTWGQNVIGQRRSLRGGKKEPMRPCPMPAPPAVMHAAPNKGGRPLGFEKRTDSISVKTKFFTGEGLKRQRGNLAYWCAVINQWHAEGGKITRFKI